MFAGQAHRRSEYEQEEDGGDGSLVDRCYEWNENRAEWLREKQEEHLRPVGESEPAYGGEEQALIEPRRYQRKKEEWARQDLLTRMAAAESEKKARLAAVRRDAKRKKAEEEEAAMVGADVRPIDEPQAQELAERLMRWEEEKQNVLSDVRKEKRAEEAAKHAPTPQLDPASRAAFEKWQTGVPVRERLMLWQEVRNHSLEDERARLQAEEQEELTFKPQISEAAQQLQRDVEVFEWLTRGQAETSKDEADAGEEEEEEEDSHGEIGQGTTFNKLARDGRVGFNRGQSSAPTTKRRPRAKTRQQTPRVVRRPTLLPLVAENWMLVVIPRVL